MEVFDFGKIKKEIEKASFSEKSQSASHPEKGKYGQKKDRQTSRGREAHIGPTVAE